MSQTETIEHAGAVALVCIREHAGINSLFADPVTPGKDEAAALASDCGKCGQRTAPTSVIDERPRRHQGQDGKYATYVCQGCGDAWLSWWPWSRV